MFTRMMITCGTSTLTNLVKGNKDLGLILNRYANTKKDSEIPKEDLERIENLLEELTSLWKNYSEDDARKMSAELNAFLLWKKQNNATPAEVYCYLVHTDTVLGNYAAMLVEDWLKEHGYLTESSSIENLNTFSMATFEMGLSNLAKWAFETFEKDPSQNYVFNVAGGFKVMSGFTLLLGQFLANETIYIFEGDNNSLLSVPRMPIRLDDVATFEDNLAAYRKVSLGISITEDELKRLNSLWVRSGIFTPLGQLAWENAKRIIYAKKIYPVPCSKVILGDAFDASVTGLPSDRIQLVNQRLDDLILFKLSNGLNNLKRLDYKQLKGNHGYTHECDAWADGKAKRLFCNEKNGNIVVEKLTDALH